ncbi:hypothetical protein IEO21_06943 [Rhodonia placenta]|uniref:Uncharacterized protein n=1 Tax=Rhodonia placenta TaxID=104341 RepID=A0A8H7NZ49_9APHY|nr:hypothetical protein IEO21_06943 [Postia placenta]
MIRRLQLALLCLCLFVFVAAQGDTDHTTFIDGTAINVTDDGFPYDPILQLRPPFARSLPVQVLLNGIVLSLSSVLLIQLLFTAQYHWPLAPLNFTLQVAAVILLVVTSVVTIFIVLSTVTAESRTWPYMLNYLAVDIPPSMNTNWPTPDLVAWLLMTATTAGLIQITHIQFLTLLFPSKLERRLIYALLGPLAITSAIMQLLRVQHNHHKLMNFVSAVQNICNAALSLLFTVSLFLWGLLVNRKNAWRMDGGTAAFGVGALTLAPMSSAIALIYVPTRDQYTWMPQLMWAIILWQSFLGWWWWVGAGMGVGELDELLTREEKRHLKRQRRLAKRKEQRERAETLWRGVTGAIGLGRQQTSSSPDRPRRKPSLSSFSTGGTMVRRIFNTQPGRQVYGWFLHWRHAHLAAARQQAVQRRERMDAVYGHEGASTPRTRSVALGWGVSAGPRRDAEAQDDETIVASESDASVDLEKAPQSGETSTEGDASVRRRVKKEGKGSLSEQPASLNSAATPGSARSSMWWWEPLRRWRLQDTTEY